MSTKTTKSGPGKKRIASLLRINSGMTRSIKSLGKKPTNETASLHQAGAAATKRQQKSATAVSPRKQAETKSGRNSMTTTTTKYSKKVVASAINPERRINSQPTGDAEVERAVQYGQIAPLVAGPVVDVLSPISPEVLSLPLQGLQLAV